MTDLPDLNAMDRFQRLDYVNDVRERQMRDPDNVADEEVRHALEALRMDRSSGAASPRRKKEPVKAIADDFF